MKVILSFVVSLLLFSLLGCSETGKEENAEDKNNDLQVEDMETDESDEEETTDEGLELDEQTEEDDKQQEVEKSLTDEEQILQVVKENLHAANNEDIDVYMTALHVESPLYHSTKETMLEIFKIYDLEYTFDEIEVMEVTGNMGKVRFVQTSIKINGPEFNDNQAEGIHTMRKYDGEWKIYDTELTNVIYLSEGGGEGGQGAEGHLMVEFFAMAIPLLDELNGNVPAQQLPYDTYQFMMEHPDLFPATESSIDKGLDYLDLDIDYRHLAKSLNDYTSTMYFDGGYIIEIYEDYIPELGGFLTELLVVNDYGEVYQILYPESLDGVFYDDYVEFIGLPTIRSGFSNVGGGYTNVIVIIASHVE